MVPMSDSFCPPKNTSAYDRQRLSAGAPLLPDLWQKIPQWPHVGKGRRVIIIGAGISGLCAAWSLRGAGFSPIILERTRRVGGRIFTLRGYFEEQHVELGATRIPDNHPLPLTYIRHFGLPLVEYPSRDQTQIYSVQGRRFRGNHGRGAEYHDDLGLTAEELRLEAHGLHDHYSQRALSILSDPRASDWPSTLDRKAFQGQSFLQSLDKLGASAIAKEICRAHAGTIIDVYDALFWLAAQRIEGETQKTYAIADGNDRLTSCFAEALGDCIVLGAHVQAVRSQSNRVCVDYVRDGRAESVQGDYVICCVPHRILLEVEFHPQLSAAKIAAIREVPMGQVTRLNYQFSRRFWNLDEGVRGLQIACTTGPIERIWDLTALQPGPNGILVAYAEHEHAAALDRLPSDETRLERGLEEIDALFPNARAAFLKGLSFSWNQSWTRGAWAAFLPDQMRYLADFQHAEGRVFFASDYMSFHNAWMQGALEAAHFAVAEVIARERAPMALSHSL